MNNKIEPEIDNDQAQPYKEPGGFLKFVGILWSIHILIAALLFPRFLLPNDNERDPKNEQKEKVFTGFRIFFGTFILFFNLFCIVAFFTRSNFVDAAKVLFILGTWTMVGVIFILFNHLRDIYALLTILEEDAIQSRDQSVMLIRAGQAALRAGNLKLHGEGNPEHLSFGYLLQKIGPLAMLVMKKSSIKNIAFEALKLALSGTMLRFLF